VSDESLFREVDEEVRQEQFKKLWDRYGNALIGLCLLVVAGVAGFKGWQYWQLKQAEEAGSAFFEASKLATAGKIDDARKQFGATGTTGYAVLARLRVAGALAGSGKVEEAVKAYDAIAADTSVAPPLRDLAQVRAAYALIDTAKADEVVRRVRSFDVAGGAWRHTAREIMALALWRAADYAGAQTQVTAILADPETPADMRQRVQMLSDLLLPLTGPK